MRSCAQWVGMMGVVGLAGCEGPGGACATFEALEVTNPDGEAPADVIAEVTAAVDQFAAWSARDGVCVGEVRLVEEIPSEKDLAGRYRGRLIEIEHGLSTDVTDVVHHELCHAADAMAGWTSRAHPQWFGTEDPVEEFADACEEGPRAASLLEAVEAGCGEDLGAARQRFIDEQVFGAAEVGDVPADGTRALQLERRPILGLGDDISWSAYAGATAVYQHAYKTDDEGVRRLSLTQVPVDTAEARLIEPVVVGEQQDARVFSSDVGPLVVGEGDAFAWLVDEAAGTVTEVPFAPYEELDDGAVVGGAAWVIGTAAGEEEETFSRVDLATGERTVLEWPEGVTRWFLAPDRGAVAGLAVPEEGGRTFLSYQPDTGAWTRSDAPWDERGGERRTLAGGLHVGTFWDSVGVDPFGFSGLAVLDPATGAWWVPDQPCGDDAIGLTLQLLSVGGEPWLWEYPSGWYGSRVEGRDGHALTRIVIDE